MRRISDQVIQLRLQYHCLRMGELIAEGEARDLASVEAAIDVDRLGLSAFRRLARIRSTSTEWPNAYPVRAPFYRT